MDGLEFLERMTAVRGHVPVVVETAQGSIGTVIKAMRVGADDFVVKPISPERLRVSIHNLLKVNALTEEVKRLNKKVGGALTFDDLIASSPAMANVMRLGRRAAQSSIPILIEGESGVGKEMIARAIQAGEIDPVGARRPVKVNIRLISATNRNMIEMVKKGEFREDLYTRTAAARSASSAFSASTMLAGRSSESLAAISAGGASSSLLSIK